MNEDRASRYHRLKRQSGFVSLAWSVALLLTLGVCAAACSSVDSSGTAAPTTEAPAVSAVGESTSTSTSTTAAPTTSTTEATTTTALADRPLPDTPEALAVELTEAERSLREGKAANAQADLSSTEALIAYLKRM